MLLLSGFRRRHILCCVEGRSRGVNKGKGIMDWCPFKGAFLYSYIYLFEWTLSQSWVSITIEGRSCGGNKGKSHKGLKPFLKKQFVCFVLNREHFLSLWICILFSLICKLLCLQNFLCLCHALFSLWTTGQNHSVTYMLKPSLSAHLWSN